MGQGEKSLVIGLDLGGTNSVFGIVDRNGEIIATTSIKTQAYRPPDNTHADAVYKVFAILSQSPNARWELLDGARHRTFIDQTDNYKRILTDWLKTDQA